jgi:hypothetical protein
MPRQVFDVELFEGVKPPLGTNTKSSTPPLSGSSTIRVQQTRAERYRLQNSARDLLLWKGKTEGLEYPANFHRTAKCIHVRIGSNVGIHRSNEHNKAFYSGLTVCGSVWSCPVCAAKIQERRRTEIAQGFDWAYANDKKMIMVTFTIPHYANQKLTELISKMRKAFTGLRAGNPWTKITQRVGYVGLIRSLEVTLGENGWHPHTHEAWIVDKETDTEALRDRIAARWLTMCKRSGIVSKSAESAFLARSVNIMDNCSTSDYLAKQDDSRNWGIDRELASASSKKSRSVKGFHPFGLLAEHAEGGEGRKDAGARFIEYATTMRDKRCRQIFWSPNLKKLVGLDDKTDEQLAEEKEDRADLLGLLDADQWRLIIKYQAKSDVLDAAESGGWGAIMTLIASLKLRAPEPTPEPITTPKPMPEPLASVNHLLSLDAYLSASSGVRSAALIRCAKLSVTQAMIDRCHPSDST